MNVDTAKQRKAGLGMIRRIVVMLTAVAMLLPVNAGLAAGATPVPAAWDQATRASTIDSAENALSGYFFVDRVPKIKAAMERDRAALLAINDPVKFADALTKLLYSVTHDKHLSVDYSPDVLPSLSRTKPSAAEVANTQRADAMMDYGYSSSARLPGNIGYFRLAFFPPPPGPQTMYDNIMKVLANTDALIVDLRGNGGGSPRAVDYLLGYFFAKPVEVTGFLLRNKSAVTTKKMYTPVDLGAPRYLDKPVYLLINQYTISGGEQFVYDLKSLHRATLVGETTAGGANMGGPVRLNDHFSIFIPIGSAHNPYTGTNWEGVGVTPDIAVSSKAALVTAYKLALQSAKNSFPPAAEGRAFALKDPAKALQIALPLH